MVSVSAAASNVLDKVFNGGVADLRPTPRVLVDHGPNRWVYRMTGDASGDPVLLVPPLAAPALCFDLRRGCSLAEHLVEQGRPTYLVDYGSVSFSDRGLGIEHWIDEVLPRAIRAASKDAGGRPVHVVAWCLGGILSLLTTADQADLPIASLTTVASPIDFTAIPLVAPARPLVELTGGWVLTAPYRLLGGAPRQLVRWAFQLSSVDKYVTKPLALLTHLDDKEFLAQIEAVDRFMDNMVAYPGRTFGQIYHRFFRGNDLHDGVVDVEGRLISLAEIKVPVLVLAGATDGIAPEPAVRRLTRLLDKAPEVRFEVCPGGHLGVLTGRSARDTTWKVIDSFLSSHAQQ
ncbi:alpha/beta fold hydrolase [Kibdelosporangium phytohabitans]|uniref:Hydrolase n=1 Tax=Kibdelosporangium phytohabitans TaxID=860235 RepID=A0A0N9IEC8_9PSEU|nr:alpha/beta fold hydrolase [Kibdelosporangium phytohabitans]ALG13513.1 hydrolase [Kibdelosporangium phytohabitans]MBE1465364.1 polyhydroxyalkanoate synthase [Kibdelosporangium phytohabitans]